MSRPPCDFLVQDKYTFEIGGKNKGTHQIWVRPHSSRCTPRWHIYLLFGDKFLFTCLRKKDNFG